MGRRGPIADPNSARSKAGRNTRTAASPPPPPPPGGIAPPATIAGSPAALAFWDRHAPILIADGRLRVEQADAFAILCQLHADAAALAEQIRAEGWITATDKGQAPSPVARLLRDARRDFVALARDFGLTAAAAARLPQESTNGEEDDEEAKLLRAFSPEG